MDYWLIQRGTLKKIKRSAIIGIDSLISFDYMGSSEFEFNTLPAALKEIVADLSKLKIKLIDDIRKDGARLAIISTKEKFADIEAFFRSQIADPHKIRLKETTDIKDTIDAKPPEPGQWFSRDRQLYSPINF